MCAENIQNLRDKIKTFVYFDVETTGRMKAGDQVSPKITEFSLIAVKSDDLPGNIPPSYTYIDFDSVLMYTFRDASTDCGFQEESK